MIAASRGDRSVLLALVTLLAAAASLTPIRNYDYWWHLKAGDWILKHRAVPRADPFSFTRAGAPWVDHEWLSQALLFLGHRMLGPEALVALKAAGVVLLCLVMAAHLRRAGCGPAAAAALLMTALLGAAVRLDVRPELATLFLAPLLVDVTLRARNDGRWLLLVPPIVAFWANLHPGAVAAPVLLAAGWAGTAMAAVAGRLASSGMPDRSPVAPGTASEPARVFTRRLGIATLAAGLAVGVNPYGFRLYAVPFEIAALLRRLPSANLEWDWPRPALFPVFWFALIATLALCAWRPRHIDPFATPILLLAGLLAARHLRNVGLFFVLLPYGVGGPLAALAGAWRGRLAAFRRRAAADPHGTPAVRFSFVAAAALLAAGVPLLAWLPPGIDWGLGVAAGNEPAAAVDFLDRERIGRRLFNDVRFGGYLIWRRYPGAPVFIDGRNEVYGSLMEEVFAALKEAPRWQALLERYAIDAAFLRYPPTLQKVLLPSPGGGAPVAAERAFAAVYFPKQDWALVYWDDTVMIVVRRIPEYDSVIARCEYRAIHPDDWSHLMSGVRAGRIPPGPILREIDRKLEEDPSCERARRLRHLFEAAARSAAGAADGG
jgi:hypothetical protein